MRDPKRIEELCDLLKEIGKRVPDWRFGQLILEDDEMLEMLIEVAATYDKHTET